MLKESHAKANIPTHATSEQMTRMIDVHVIERRLQYHKNINCVFLLVVGCV